MLGARSGKQDVGCCNLMAVPMQQNEARGSHGVYEQMGLS